VWDSSKSFNTKSVAASIFIYFIFPKFHQFGTSMGTTGLGGARSFKFLA